MNALDKAKALLAKSENFKSTSKLLGAGGKLIDHAGGVGNAVGEISVGSPGQAPLTLIDTFGKAAFSGTVGTAVGTVFTVAGPVGTVVGGAAGDYAASKFWDKTIGSAIGWAKGKLGDSADDAAEKAISKSGKTLAEIMAISKAWKIEKAKAIAAAKAASVTIVNQGSVWDDVNTITLTEVTDSDGKKTIVYTTTDKDGKVIGKIVYDGSNPGQEVAQDVAKDMVKGAARGASRPRVPACDGAGSCLK